ncbi:MAG: hypothetical protein OXU20_12265 [Myxococcales bacterium]|nr:hypothetical protein [Myxococcales bacterium]
MLPMRTWLERNRQRLSRLVLVGAALAVGMTVWNEVPRETELEYFLGPQHGDVVELRVSYLREGDMLHGARFDFPGGAPSQVRHTVALPPGRLQVQVERLTRGGYTTRTTRSLQTPTDGLVRILP